MTRVCSEVSKAFNPWNGPFFSPDCACPFPTSSFEYLSLCTSSGHTLVTLRFFVLCRHLTNFSQSNEPRYYSAPHMPALYVLDNTWVSLFGLRKIPHELLHQQFGGNIRRIGSCFNVSYYDILNKEGYWRVFFSTLRLHGGASQWWRILLQRSIPCPSLNHPSFVLLYTSKGFMANKASSKLRVPLHFLINSF